MNFDFDRGKFESEVKHMNEKVREALQEFYNTTGYTLMHIAKKCAFLTYDDINSFILEEKELTVVQLQEIDRFMMDN